MASSAHTVVSPHYIMWCTLHTTTSMLSHRTLHSYAHSYHQHMRPLPSAGLA